MNMTSYSFSAITLLSQKQNDFFPSNNKNPFGNASKRGFSIFIYKAHPLFLYILVTIHKTFLHLFYREHHRSQPITFPASTLKPLHRLPFAKTFPSWTDLLVSQFPQPISSYFLYRSFRVSWPFPPLLFFIVSNFFTNFNLFF